MTCSELPSTITQTLWPGKGQMHWSPTRATGIPSTVNQVALTLTTFPPCEVGSLRRMTLGIFKHRLMVEWCHHPQRMLAYWLQLDRHIAPVAKRYWCYADRCFP